MRIGMVATGGTIAARRDERGDLVPHDGGSELLASVELPDGVAVTHVDLPPRPSFDSTLDDMLGVVDRVRNLLRDGCHGVVITHGTDALEELAFLCSMLLPAGAPVVLTGAQRAADTAQTDGPANLRDAFAVVCSPLAAGVMVVFGGLVIAGSEARKTHTSSVITFSGGAAGAVATVDEGEVLWLSRGLRGALYAGEPLPASLPRVDIVKLAAGTDAVHIEASINAGAQGLVVEAMGRGNAGQLVVDGVAKAVANGITTVISSRTGGGLVRPDYGKGGGADLVRAGAFFAGDLTSPRARVALSLALSMTGHGTPEEQLHRIWGGAR